MDAKRLNADEALRYVVFALSMLAPHLQAFRQNLCASHLNGFRVHISSAPTYTVG